MAAGRAITQILCTPAGGQTPGLAAGVVGAHAREAQGPRGRPTARCRYVAAAMVPVTPATSASGQRLALQSSSSAESRKLHRSCDLAPGAGSKIEDQLPAGGANTEVSEGRGDLDDLACGDEGDQGEGRSGPQPGDAEHRQNEDLVAQRVEPGAGEHAGRTPARAGAIRAAPARGPTVEHVAARGAHGQAEHPRQAMRPEPERGGGERAGKRQDISRGGIKLSEGSCRLPP